MAEIIKLSDHAEFFDHYYGVCKKCDSDDWKMIVDENSNIIGFRCSDIDCTTIGMLEENRHIRFELDESE